MTQQPPTQDWTPERVIALGVGALGFLTGGWAIIKGIIEQRRQNKEQEVTTLKQLFTMAKEFVERDEAIELQKARATIDDLYAKLQLSQETITAAQDARNYAENRITELHQDVERIGRDLSKSKETIEAQAAAIAALKAGKAKHE